MTRAILTAGLCCLIGSPQAPVVFRVGLTELSPQGVQMVQAALNAAQRRGGVVVLEMASPAGAAEAAERIANAIADSPVLVYTLVSGGTWEGAALIALAADSAFITAGASIGADPAAAAATAPESIRSAVRTLIAAGTVPALAAAMFDPALDVPGAPPGTRLTLTGGGAVTAGLAVGPVDGFEDALVRAGLRGADPINVDLRWLGTTVHVANRNSRDVRIFVRRGGRSRLGNVTSLNDAEFHIPAQLLIEGSLIELTAEVIGSTERVTTERIRVEPGLLIEWVIEEAIRQSNYFVSRRY